MSKNLLMILIISTLFAAFLEMPSHALMPMHPDDVKRLKAEGKYDGMIQQWIDFKNNNPPNLYSPDELDVIPERTEKIREVIRGDLILEASGIDFDGNGQVDERDFLELAFPVERSTQQFNAPTIGVQKSIVILVDFEDRQGNPDYGTAYIDDLLFSDGTRPKPSLRDYFKEVSRELVDCVGTVADSGENGGWFRVDGNAASYFGFDNAPDLVKAAVDLADPYVDFSEFDNNGNGWVESLIVVVSGEAEWETFWPHKYYIPGGKAVDGVRLYPYFLAAESSKVGTFCHEHGHAMGLPDLYDYDGSSYGVGYWCLMAYGGWSGDGHEPTHLSAWCKYTLGWINTCEVTHGITNAPIYGTPNTAVIYKIQAMDVVRHEYFLIENRRKQGYDSKLPGEGVLIWHINMGGNQEIDDYRKVDLEEADGRDDIDTKENAGDNTDPYYFESGNFRFSDSTYPNSKNSLGEPSGVTVSSISEQLWKMTANLLVDSYDIDGLMPDEPGFIEPIR